MMSVLNNGIWYGTFTVSDLIYLFICYQAVRIGSTGALQRALLPTAYANVCLNV